MAPAIALLLHALAFLWIGPILSKNHAKPVQPIQFEMIAPIQIAPTASGLPQKQAGAPPQQEKIEKKAVRRTMVPKEAAKPAPVIPDRPKIEPSPLPVPPEEAIPVAPPETAVSEHLEEVVATPSLEEIKEGPVSESPTVAGAGEGDGSDRHGVKGGAGISEIGSSQQPLVIGPVSSGLPDTDGLGRFRNAAFQQIQRHQQYPKRARDRGIEGIVYVQFSIDAQGRVQEVEILPPADAHPLLAQAAMETIRKASPLPPVPDRLKGQKRIVITLGMQFELK